MQTIPTPYRTLWISDLHLGTRGCQAEALLDFLRSTESDTLFLVGDILDGWQLKKRWFWSEAQDEVVRTILAKARAGTRVVYVPGNHDEALRAYGALRLGGVQVAAEWIHETADGRRLLVHHGDRFDAVVTCHRWLALLGDWAYQLVLAANTHVNRVRRALGFPYWSLAGFVKQRVKDAVSYVTEFERAVAHAARKRGLDGVVCGHIHKAEMREIEGVLYCNDGDWVESCTALAEHASGRLEILDWTARVPLEMRLRRGQRRLEPAAPRREPLPAGPLLDEIGLPG